MIHELLQVFELLDNTGPESDMDRTPTLASTPLDEIPVFVVSMKVPL